MKISVSCFLVLELQLPCDYKVISWHAENDKVGIKKEARFNDLKQLWMTRQIHLCCV